MMGEYFVSKKGLVDDFVKGFATCEELVVLLASSCRINPYITVGDNLMVSIVDYLDKQLNFQRFPHIVEVQ